MAAAGYSSLKSSGQVYGDLRKHSWVQWPGQQTKTSQRRSWLSPVPSSLSQAGRLRSPRRAAWEATYAAHTSRDPGSEYILKEAPEFLTSLRARADHCTSSLGPGSSFDMVSTPHFILGELGSLSVCFGGGGGH